MKDVLTPAELAKKMGVSEETVMSWRDLGMPWVKVGKSIYILERSFLSWMKRLEKTKNAQDAPGRDFFGKSMEEVIPPKS